MVFCPATWTRFWFDLRRWVENGRAGVVLKIRNVGMQSEVFLCSPLFLEAQLTSLLLYCLNRVRVG